MSNLTNLKFKACLCALLLMLPIFTVGCQTSTVITTLDAVVAAAEIALPLIPGIPANVRADAVQALQLTGTGVDCAGNELSGTDAALVQASKIDACLQPAIAKLTGLPPAAQAITNAVLLAVQRFLQPFQPALVRVISNQPKPVRLPLSRGDLEKLEVVKAHNAKVTARLAALR